MNHRIRLAHRIAVDGFYFGAYREPGFVKAAGNVKGHLQSGSCQVFVLDNVFDAIFKNLDGVYSITELSGCVPPFPESFFEWTYQHRGFTEMHGIFVQSFDVQNEKVPNMGVDIDARCRWVCGLALCAITEHSGGPQMIPFKKTIQIDGNGKPISCIVGHAHEIPDEVCKSKEHAIVLFAMSLMSCKNVSRVDVPAEMLPDQKWQRRQAGKIKGLQFKTLRIDGIGGGSRPPSGEPTGAKNSFHICRGSFAEYTAERPLFGKYVGRFWRPAHVKGSKEVGVVEKDYEIGMGCVQETAERVG